MKDFITVLFKERKASKKVVEAINKSANIPLTESKKTKPLVFEHDGGIAVRVELPKSLNERLSELTVDSLAGKLFEMGYDDFEIETTIPQEEMNEAAQRVPALDAIVDQFAQPGMTLAQLQQLEQAAIDAEPENYDRENDPEGQGVRGLARDVGNFINRTTSTEDFRLRYVLAHASWKLGLPGIYGTRRGFYYIDSTGEAKSSRGGNLDQALAVAQAGLLPERVMNTINNGFSRYDNVQPGDAQGRRIQQKLQAIRTAYEAQQSGGTAPTAPVTPGDNDAQSGGGQNDGSDSAQNAPGGDGPASAPTPRPTTTAMDEFRSSLEGKTSAELRQMAMDLNGQLIDLLDVIGESAIQQEIYFMLNEGAREDAQIAEIVEKLIILQQTNGTDGAPAIEGPNARMIEATLERAQQAVDRHRAAAPTSTGDAPAGGTTDTEAGAEDSETADNPEGEGVAFEYRGTTYYADPTRRTLSGRNFYRVYETQDLTPTPRWPKKATEGHASGIYALIEEAIFAGEGMEMGYDPELPALGTFADSGKRGLANDPDETDAIDELQAFLRIPRTGVYDEATVAAVRAYQEANGLTVDGDAGPETIGHMQGRVESEGEDAVAQDKWENATLLAPEDQPYEDEIAFDVGDGVIATVPAEYVEGGTVMVRWGESTPVEEELPDRILDLISEEMDRRANGGAGPEDGEEGEGTPPVTPDGEEGEGTPPVTPDGEEGEGTPPVTPDGEEGEGETTPGTYNTVAEAFDDLDSYEVDDEITVNGEVFTVMETEVGGETVKSLTSETDAGRAMIQEYIDEMIADLGI